MENKDAGDDDFVTQEERGKKAQGEKVAAIEWPKRVIKLVDKFTPIEKKKTLQKSVPIKPKAAIQAPRKQRICPFSVACCITSLAVGSVPNPWSIGQLYRL